ncbi:MAG TPA: tRNA (adenosine(37)-N6)-threonylcarbamoyltransferase complex dimerization subunit type 1 TsaB [Kofleriaceae bacterium]|nr:tRNA (adenosine(37)-N6)-threonylcarbamoyltransferase complex dimerization subunit type 1 TsaB [Kofleriaceae bacterium]
MVILALDTSSADGSAAALRRGGDTTVTIERAGDGTRSHGTRLPRELMAVLEEAGAAIEEVDRLAVVVGPGSFTGLRVGIATIQGLALARGVMVVPVTSFEALARHAGPSDDAIALWVEAHRGEVFATLLAPDARTVLAPPTALPPATTLDAWRDAIAPFPRVRFLGDGAVRYEAVIRERLGAQASLDVRLAAPMLAAAAASIASEAPDRAVHPHALVPMYVRRPDVELTRDRREAASRR